MGRDSTLLDLAEKLHSELCDAKTRFTDFFVQFREVDLVDGQICPTGRLSKLYGWRWDRDRINADGSVGGWLDADEIADPSINVLDAAPRHFDLLCDDEHGHLMAVGSRGAGKSEFLQRWLQKRIAIAPKKASSLVVTKRRKARKFVEKKILPQLPDSWLSCGLGNKGRKGYRKANDEISLSFRHGGLLDCLSSKVVDDARGDDIVTAAIDESQLCPREGRANLFLSVRDSSGMATQTAETATKLAGDFEDYLDGCESNPSYRVELLSITDNIHLDRVYDEYYGREVPEPVVWARREMPLADFEQEIGVYDSTDGRFYPRAAQQTGLVYYQFRRPLHVRAFGDDPESVVRAVCSSIEPTVGEDITYRTSASRWRAEHEWLVGVDFDPAPLAAVAAKVFKTPSGWPDLLWVVHEFAEHNADATALGQQVMGALGGGAAVPDAAGRFSGGKRSSVVLLRDCGLDVRGPVKNPEERNRINAVNAKLQNGSEQVALLIDPQCKRTIASLQKQRLGAGGTPTGMSGGEDHFAKALGHLVHYLYPVGRRQLLQAKSING